MVLLGEEEKNLGAVSDFDAGLRVEHGFRAGTAVRRPWKCLLIDFDGVFAGALDAEALALMAPVDSRVLLAVPARTSVTVDDKRGAAGGGVNERAQQGAALA